MNKTWYLYILVVAVIAYAAYEAFTPGSIEIPNSQREPTLYDLFGDTTLETTAIGGRLERTEAGYSGRTAPDKGALGVDFGTNLGVQTSGPSIADRVKAAFDNFRATAVAPTTQPVTVATPPASTYTATQAIAPIAASQPAVTTQPAPTPTYTTYGAGYGLPANFNLGRIPYVNSPA